MKSKSLSNKKPLNKPFLLEYKDIINQITLEFESKVTATISKYKLYSKKSVSRVNILSILNKSLKKAIHKSLNNQYNTTNEQYNKQRVDEIIGNKHSHHISKFKDYIIFSNYEEYLKRYYKLKECYERVPKISNYYKNYLKFFCNPTFRDFEANSIIQVYGDQKAELYYNRNYGRDKTNFNENNTIIKSIFSNTIKEEIFNTSLTSTLSTNNKILNNRLNRKPQQDEHIICIQNLNKNSEQPTLNSINLDANAKGQIIRSSHHIKNSKSQNDNFQLNISKISQDSVFINLVSKIENNQKKHFRIKSTYDKESPSKNKLNLNNIEFTNKNKSKCGTNSSANFNTNFPFKIFGKASNNKNFNTISNEQSNKNIILNSLISKLKLDNRIKLNNIIHNKKQSIEIKYTSEENNKKESYNTIDHNTKNLINPDNDNSKIITNQINSIIKNTNFPSSRNNNNNLISKANTSLVKNKQFSSYQYKSLEHENKHNATKNDLKSKLSPNILSSKVNSSLLLKKVSSSNVINFSNNNPKNYISNNNIFINNTSEPKYKLITRSIKITSDNSNYNKEMNKTKEDEIVNITVSLSINKKTNTEKSYENNPNINLNKTRNRSNNNQINKASTLANRQNTIQHYEELIQNDPFIRSNNVSNVNHLEASIKNLKTVLNSNITINQPIQSRNSNLNKLNSKNSINKNPKLQNSSLEYKSSSKIKAVNNQHSLNNRNLMNKITSVIKKSPIIKNNYKINPYLSSISSNDNYLNSKVKPSPKVQLNKSLFKTEKESQCSQNTIKGNMASYMKNN